MLILFLGRPVARWTLVIAIVLDEPLAGIPDGIVPTAEGSRGSIAMISPRGEQAADVVGLAKPEQHAEVKSRRIGDGPMNNHRCFLLKGLLNSLLILTSNVSFCQVSEEIKPNNV